MSILNKFFLKREEGTHHGGAKINAMTHLPRVFSVEDALTLAADLTKLSGGPAELEAYLVAAYGGRAEFEAACKSGYEAKAAAAKQAKIAKAAQAQAAQAKEDAGNLAEAKLMASAGKPLIPVPPAPVVPVAFPDAPTPPAAETKAAEKK